LGLLVWFIFLAAQTTLATTEQTYVSGQCTLLFNVDEGFTLTGEGTNSLTLMVESGEINASASTISVYTARGRLAFNSANTSTLNATSGNPENFDLRIDGGTFTLFNHTYTLSIPSNVPIIISWKFYPTNPIDEYFMLGLGLAGVGFMIFSPCWVTWEVKKHGVTEVAVERFGYAMLMFIVGFGLIVMYLWGGG